MKITSPVEGYTGTSQFGPVALKFEDGVATHDGDLSDGLRAYLAQVGYGLGSSKATPPPADPEPVDPTTLGDGQVGTKLRDAAVDPRPDDFLAPTNAGQANPHGPDVVSPEVHASQGVRPIKPGDVHVDDTDAQDDAETEHAELHTSGEPVLDGVQAPAGNASRDAWSEYDVATGGTGEGTRDEIRARHAAA